jgi:asparagine synthase (glutamine-hydrolysing)
MCGITGILAFTDKGAGRLQKTVAATAALQRRGPDGGGVCETPRAWLGHRRLSIIDTSDNGAQPMTDPTGRYSIIFNGEIFNYRALKQQYFPGKDDWQSASDTELLLHLYIQQREACLPLLSGFFAFAIYDHVEETLFLARDRFGKKPLLYTATEDYFAFASEMKGLLAYDIPRVIDYTVLLQYLQLNYIPQPQSLLQGVQKLPPGHYLVVKNSVGEARAYYELQIRRPAAVPGYEAAQQQLVSLLDESVQKRLIADVPLGAFLSGGIDSSVVVALASRHTSRLSTFSIGYKDHPFFDETRYARLVADRYKTNHTVFSLGSEDFLAHIDGVLSYIDEPFADSSALPLYILSRHTRQHVTVALSGDGGDEVFAGYNKHAAEWKMRQRGLLNRLVQAGGPLWKRLPQSRNTKLTNLFRQLSRFAEGASLGPRDRYWRWAGFMDQGQAMQLLAAEKRSLVEESRYAAVKSHLMRHLDGGAALEDFLLTDMELVLLSDMLVKVDLMSMANGLEVRSPFLDHAVVDFAFSLPTAYKIDGRMKKKIVQDAFRSQLPPEIYNRPKHGFEIPLLDWFRRELRPLITDQLLADDFIAEQGIFHPPAISSLKQRLFSGNPGDAHATTWALLVFQSWWKQWMA